MAVYVIFQIIIFSVYIHINVHNKGPLKCGSVIHEFADATQKACIPFFDTMNHTDLDVASLTLKTGLKTFFMVFDMFCYS